MKINNIDKLQQILGYQFSDNTLCELALSHRSLKAHHNYERLEFLGDALLSLVIAKYLYHSFPQKQEGKLTRMRATLVRQETLASVARHLNLGSFLQLGTGEIKAGGRQRDSILADVVESLLGAIYLDCNDIAVLETIVAQWFASPMAHIDDMVQLKDNKSQLQEWLQAKKMPLPSYHLERIEGKAPNEIFYVVCDVMNSNKQTLAHINAQGKSRRIAEQNAAKAMLDLLKK